MATNCKCSLNRAPSDVTKQTSLLARHLDISPRASNSWADLLNMCPLKEEYIEAITRRAMLRERYANGLITEREFTLTSADIFDELDNIAGNALDAGLLVWKE